MKDDDEVHLETDTLLQLLLILIRITERIHVGMQVQANMYKNIQNSKHSFIYYINLELI